MLHVSVLLMPFQKSREVGILPSKRQDLLPGTHFAKPFFVVLLKVLLEFSYEKSAIVNNVSAALLSSIPEKFWKAVRSMSPPDYQTPKCSG